MIKTDAKPATPELIANLIELGAIYVKDGEFYANEPGTYRKGIAPLTANQTAIPVVNNYVLFALILSNKE